MVFYNDESHKTQDCFSQEGNFASDTQKACGGERKDDCFGPTHRILTEDEDDTQSVHFPLSNLLTIEENYLQGGDSREQNLLAVTMLLKWEGESQTTSL